MPLKLCSVAGCGKPVNCRGLCDMHNWRLVHKGSVGSVEPRIVHDPAKRLEKKRRITAKGCWEWAGYRNEQGYGITMHRGRVVSAHRLSAMVHLGFDIESPLCVLHKCDNPPCFNPDHLFIGTDRDNVHDMIAKGRVRHARGEETGVAVVNKETVRRIRRDFANGDTVATLARRYGVCWSQAKNIVTRRSWKHVA